MDKDKNLYNIKLNFLFDDGNDEKIVQICVPINISAEKVCEVLMQEHDYLCFEDESDRYGICGREPGTLLDFVCEKYKWEWKSMDYDIDLEFE